MEKKAYNVYSGHLPFESKLRRQLMVAANSLAISLEGNQDPVGKFYYLNKALSIAQSQADLKTDDVANIHNNIGVSYWEESLYEAALSNLQAALALWRARVPVDSNQLAVTYNNLALVHESLHQLPEALADYQAALQYLTGQSDAKGRSTQASILNNLSFVYQTMGQFTQAIHCRKAALELEELVYGLGSVQVAKFRSSLGSILSESRNFQRAEACFASAEQSFLELGLAQSLDRATNCLFLERTLC
ncbi:MAG: tetratricopeptide repeat protein [Lewinella sp.]|nr:tetratricopeptide repeat protein [Lewinella sp.]